MDSTNKFIFMITTIVFTIVFTFTLLIVNMSNKQDQLFADKGYQQCFTLNVAGNYLWKKSCDIPTPQQVN